MCIEKVNVTKFEFHGNTVKRECHARQQVRDKRIDYDNQLHHPRQIPHQHHVVRIISLIPWCSCELGLKVLQCIPLSDRIRNFGSDARESWYATPYSSAVTCLGSEEIVSMAESV